MADELRLKMDLTLREAALIKFLRDTNEFTNVTIVKVNGKIERIRNEELRTIKNLQEEYGLSVDSESTIDKSSQDAIVE